jgi:pimeloyl-ACP methyl ester carboxylesterase
VNGFSPLVFRGLRTSRRRWFVGGSVLLIGALLASCSSGGSFTASSTPVVSDSPAGSSSSAALSTASSASSGGPASTSSGSTGASAAAASSYESAPCPNPVYPAAPSLGLGPEFSCGYLTVPQDRQDPSGKTIKIAVAKIKASTPNAPADPIVYLAGGPGGSGLLSAVQRVSTGWNSDREVVFVDQRGTWKSDPLLACPEIDQFNVDALALVSTDPATAEKSGAATRACRDRIIAEGWDPAAYNTTENAADIADLRTTMGYDEWNLYGVSYGTDLALQTLRDHPDGIRSVVLDSVVPPQENIFDGFWPSAANGFDALFRDCEADTACNAAYPSVRADFATLVNELTDQPRTVTIPDTAGTGTVDVVIDGYKLANLVLSSSLGPGLIAPLPAIIDNLAHGDGTLAAQRLLITLAPSGVTAFGLALGVFCSEHAQASSAEQIMAAGKAVLPDFPDAVLKLAPQAPWIFSDCAQWDVPPAAAAVGDVVNSDVPVLIVSGELDAVTAPPNAAAVAPGLTSSHSLLFPDSAHDVMIWSPECGVSVMHNFLNQPVGFDDSCVAALQPAPFSVS